MTKKKALITLLTAIFLISVITPAAMAGPGGDRYRNRQGNKYGNRPKVTNKYKQHRPQQRHYNRYGKWQQHRPNHRRPHYRPYYRPSHRARVYVQPDLGLLLGGLIIGGIIVHGLNHQYNQDAQNPDNDSFWEDEDVEWQIESVWVEPTYRKAWVFGYTNRRGNWVSGHWKKKLVKAGHWKTVRVRVSENK